ncbi:MAG: hypothetical protein AAFU77_12925 [Myxococcota bacterium]
MDEQLVMVLVDQMCFLELSGDDVINPDAAVRQMESIVAVFEELDSAQKEQLKILIERQAQEARARGIELRAEFIESLPEALGLR